MKNRLWLVTALLFALMPLASFADDTLQDQPTFKQNPDNVGRYHTGANPAELTLEQYNAQKELESKKDEITFAYDVHQIGRYPVMSNLPERSAPLKRALSLGDGEKLKSFSLAQFGKKLNPVLNQGNCGSCVIFAFIANIQDLFALRGMDIPTLSPQHLMNCGTGYQCNGAFGEGVAKDTKDLGDTGGLNALVDYPYTQRTAKCTPKAGAPKYGPITDWDTIDGSPRSILSALYEGKGSSVGVAANSTFMSYARGIYNGCNSMSTNHYVYIEGVDCGSAVDAEGYCQFDANGNLPANSGATFRVRNSWGKNWGEDGYITMLITGKNGRRCNNIAGGEGNAQIIDNGVPMPPPGPVVLEFKKRGYLKVTVEPGEYRADDIAASLMAAGF